MYLCLIWKIKEKYKEVLISNGIAWEEERHTEDLNADVVMKSPGFLKKRQL
jgi:UDP-N-acetylmuramoylalanine--D-glutamate ligase